MEVKYFEMIVTTHLKESIPFESAGTVLGDLINKTMLKSPDNKALHESKGFKHYCFGSLFPIEKDKVYKSGNVYTFKIRSLNMNFIEGIRRNIKSVVNEKFNILAVEVTSRNQRYISDIYTLTPVVVTMEDNKNWTMESDFLVVKERLKANAINASF